MEYLLTQQITPIGRATGNVDASRVTSFQDDHFKYEASRRVVVLTSNWLILFIFPKHSFGDWKTSTSSANLAIGEG